MISTAGARCVALVLGTVLGAATLAACGSDEPEASARVTTVEDYCVAYDEYFQERAALAPQATDAEVIASMKGWAAQLEQLDAPEEMPPDARAGMELWVDLIDQIDDDASQQDVMAMEQELPEEDTARVQAFFLFNDDTCLRGGTAG